MGFRRIAGLTPSRLEEAVENGVQPLLPPLGVMAIATGADVLVST
jgi:hypothetical protein